jgi:hypothetical protein
LFLLFCFGVLVDLAEMHFVGVKRLIFWSVVVRSEVGMMDFSMRLELEESYKLISFRKVTKYGCFLA